MENLFFFPPTDYSKISALGTAIDWGHSLQHCQFGARLCLCGQRTGSVPHLCTARTGRARGWCCVWLRGHPSCAPGQNGSKGSSSRLSLKEVRVSQSEHCEYQLKASFDQSLVFKKTIFLLPQI